MEEPTKYFKRDILEYNQRVTNKSDYEDVPKLLRLANDRASSESTIKNYISVDTLADVLSRKKVPLS